MSDSGPMTVALSPAGGQRRCAVLGSPITHSLSPALHRAAYAAVGLDWSYDAVEVGEPALPGFLDGLDASWRGLSLTMPLKRTVVPLLDELSDGAAMAGAVNTVVLDQHHRSGHNTDIPGAVAALRERLPNDPRHAVVLGGGATATSVLFALADLGCRDVVLVVREVSRARPTLEAVSRHPGPPHVDVADFTAPPRPVDVLVSTIPAAAQRGVVVGLAEEAAAVFDVVYDPWPTPLAASAVARGQVLVSGLDLLVHQAAGQFSLMTGLEPPPLHILVEAGHSALEDR